MQTFQWTNPWQAIQPGCEARLETELKLEFPSGHALQRGAARAVARRMDCDDVLFELSGITTSYAVVRLTWPGRHARGGVPPKFQLFNSFPEFQVYMAREALEWNN